jgi:hypothetical protein
VKKERICGRQELIGAGQRRTSLKEILLRKLFKDFKIDTNEMNVCSGRSHKGSKYF